MNLVVGASGLLAVLRVPRTYAKGTPANPGRPVGLHWLGDCIQGALAYPQASRHTPDCILATARPMVRIETAQFRRRTLPDSCRPPGTPLALTVQLHRPAGAFGKTPGARRCPAPAHAGPFQRRSLASCAYDGFYTEKLEFQVISCKHIMADIAHYVNLHLSHFTYLIGSA